MIIIEWVPAFVGNSLNYRIACMCAAVYVWSYKTSFTYDNTHARTLVMTATSQP